MNQSLLSLKPSHFCFNATPPTEIYTLSLHDALPISLLTSLPSLARPPDTRSPWMLPLPRPKLARSEEHTSELQSRRDLVCRLLLEKKKLIKRIDRLHRASSSVPWPRAGLRR